MTLFFLISGQKIGTKIKAVLFLPLLLPCTWRGAPPGRCYHSAQKNAFEVEFALNPANPNHHPVHYAVDLDFEVHLRSSASICELIVFDFAVF